MPYPLLPAGAPFEGKRDHTLRRRAKLEQAPSARRGKVDSVPTKLDTTVMRALQTWQTDPKAGFHFLHKFRRAIDACIAEATATPPPTLDPPNLPTIRERSSTQYSGAGSNCRIAARANPRATAAADTAMPGPDGANRFQPRRAKQVSTEAE
jgi:hypothetical protein